MLRIDSSLQENYDFRVHILKRRIYPGTRAEENTAGVVLEGFRLIPESCMRSFYAQIPCTGDRKVIWRSCNTFHLKRDQANNFQT